MVWVAFGGERECPFEIGDGRGGVKAERSFAGQREEAPRGLLQGGYLIRLSGRASQLQGGRVVVSEHVCQVFHSVGGLRFDPGRCGDMACCTGGAGQLVVGDVAGEDVPEGVLGLRLHRGAPCGANQLLA